MPDAVPRALVEAFYRTYATRDAGRIAEFLDDDVMWTISGPVDVLPFCGTHRGKAAVLDLIERSSTAEIKSGACFFSLTRYHALRFVREEPAMLRRIVMITAAVVAAAPAFALDIPPRKPGLWEVTMQFVGGKIPPQVVKQCVDAESDKLMNSQFGGSAQQQNCSKKDVSNTAAPWSWTLSARSATRRRRRIRSSPGSFDSAYTVNVTSKREGGKPVPGMPPTGSMQMTIAAKWLGACATDQKPGDMIMANGMKVNVFEMPGMPKRQ